jgi:hypothetical protein
MDEIFRGFFSASVAASAAFIGLLFVALSFIEGQAVDEPTRELRQIYAQTAFALLVNIFFVSMVSLYANLQGIAAVACILAVVGFIASMRVWPRAAQLSKQRAGLNRVPRLLPGAAYVIEFAAGLALLHNPEALNYLAGAVIILYSGALTRAWELTGLRRH